MAGKISAGRTSDPEKASNSMAVGILSHGCDLLGSELAASILQGPMVRPKTSQSTACREGTKANPCQEDCIRGMTTKILKRAKRLPLAGDHRLQSGAWKNCWLDHTVDKKQYACM